MLVATVLLAAAFGLLAPAHASPRNNSVRLTAGVPMRHRLMAAGKYPEYLSLKEKLRVFSADAVKNKYSQPVDDLEDMIYYAEVHVGTPGQKFMVVLDTGSANLWIPDSTCAPQQLQAPADCPSFCSALEGEACAQFCERECCKHSEHKLHQHLASLLVKDGGDDPQPEPTDACKKKNKFESGKSVSYLPDGRPFKIAYGTGSAKGFFGKDVVCFHPTSLCIPDQTFGQATSLAPFFADQPIDGILGLGFTGIAVGKVTPPFIKAVEEKLVEEPVFTVYMARSGLRHVEQGGWFTYGGLDPEHCGEVIAYEPLSSATFWQFNLLGLKAGDYKLTEKSQAISDTGTSLIAGPEAIVEKIAAAVGATYNKEYQSYVIDCANQGPDVIFTIGEHDFHVKSEHYTVQVAKDICEFGVFAFGGGGYGPQWILGDPFLRAYCNIHDVAQKRIGFAKPLKN
uniref:Peptidase A1 domain-containing protein n=1 Tax=Steinernema glaseri TaxID=37863 RepID=A0A1I7YTA7_9BILA